MLLSSPRRESFDSSLLQIPFIRGCAERLSARPLDNFASERFLLSFRTITRSLVHEMSFLRTSLRVPVITFLAPPALLPFLSFSLCPFSQRCRICLFRRLRGGRNGGSDEDRELSWSSLSLSFSLHLLRSLSSFPKLVVAHLGPEVGRSPYTRV